MAEHHYHETYKETRPAGSTSTGTIAFIVGGLVVAVGLIFFWLFGGADMADGGASTAPNVEINATSGSEAGADTSAGAGTAPVAEDSATPPAADASGADAEAGASATAGTD
ncbi:hypothetical protein ATO6_12920 [Oceanicola sp. 22II-s10i]|uniref:hypothetical protein n=1 Tax=Oceanicola sp. 22II-s10i TaxID=1317116 RepID=UPI000B523981|nr:hypothetical protein [Oceanicola sp. 22II-s10i]OWU84566.1 hypothetical protein ATO6_12920 [Oceanicola sp. 22II-s10i]